MTMGPWQLKLSRRLWISAGLDDDVYVTPTKNKKKKKKEKNVPITVDQT